LSELLRAKLIEFAEDAGFAKVDFELDRPDRPVEGNELRFERDSGQYVDVVYAFFDKYDCPRFQIVFSRRARINSEKIVKSGRVVRNPSQHYYEWGKPRWLPAALWPDARAERCVDEAVHRLPHVLRWLAEDDSGPRAAD
jgi:hypothetical protein